jgi:hypothetical protein
MSAVKEVFHDDIEKGQRAVMNDRREYPILFDTEMIQSIVSGNKTTTRRLFKSPFCKVMEPASVIYYENGNWMARFKNGKLLDYPVNCPYGQPGDVLWVKETMDYSGRYKADIPPKNKYSTLGWIPSIHMPKNKARLWLQITEIKAQRIQSVTEDEANQEGTKTDKIFGFGETGQSNYREGFIAKWISVYGIESFYENPWVWVINFNVVEPVSTKQIDTV